MKQNRLVPESVAHPKNLPWFFRSAFASVITLALLLSPAFTSAQQLLISNPHWNITVSDFGYSDFMLDNTPGFEGREYLSGEWAAAVAYHPDGEPAIMPTWLEPNFVFPDWTSDSTFHVVTPLAEIALNADGLPIAESVVANGDLEITLRHEMLDTIVGTPMGVTPASSTGTVASVSSDRYVLKQTCTIRNISGAAISNVQLFQFLHGLNSQRGVFDNRLHSGPLSEFRYDVTLAGSDPWATGAGSSSAGLEDFISFHANVAPGAFEIGRYGIEGNGVDDHFLGKPSDGVHLSIETNWLAEPYASRQGTDEFAPAQRWIAGAQRWDLGNLAAGQSVNFEVLLSLLTGTKVSIGTGSSGGCNGGSTVPGGLDYEFEDVSTGGDCFAEYSKADDNEISVRIAEGEFEAFSFFLPGGPAQLWEVDFTGTYSGAVHLTFAYDATILPGGFEESLLCIYQYSNGAWQKLPGTVNPALNTISVTTTTLSAFVLGVDSDTTFTVAASSLPANSGTITGAGTYVDGSSATLVAAGTAGYVFTNWTENGSIISSSPSHTFIVHSNRTLTANFSLVGTGRIITTSALPSNGGSTTGDGEYALGSDATVVATPNPGYKFSKWRVNEVTVSSSASYTFTVTDNQMLEAKFKPVCAITVAAEPAEGGEPEADPIYEYGELAVLKAKPNAGFCLVNWTQNGVPVSTAENYSFNVTADRDLVAHYAPGNNITTGSDPMSSGTTSGGGVYQNGSTATVQATPNPGYVFLHWKENGNPVSTSAAYTFTCNSSRSLLAYFIAQPTLTSAQAAPDFMILSWPVGVSPWVLQENSGLLQDSWTNCTRLENVVNGRRTVTVSPLTTSGFFRLVLPKE